MMRSLFLDFQLVFATGEDRELSEDILLGIISLVAKLSLYQLRQLKKKDPAFPTLYSKAAGIRYCPPDQAEGSWIDVTRVKELVAKLRDLGAKDDKIAIVLRLVAGTEIFQDLVTLYRSKRGDCDRLVATRLAELWNAGIIARPYLIPFPNNTGGITYHAVVQHVDKSSEDPSAILGMPCAPGVREEEIRKNYERRDNLMKDAEALMVYGGASPEMLGAMVDSAAYVPVGGYA